MAGDGLGGVVEQVVQHPLERQLPGTHLQARLQVLRRGLDMVGHLVVPALVKMRYTEALAAAREHDWPRDLALALAALERTSCRDL